LLFLLFLYTEVVKMHFIFFCECGFHPFVMLSASVNVLICHILIDSVYGKRSSASDAIMSLKDMRIYWILLWRFMAGWSHCKML
jgi:hypothetical protein